MFPRQRMSNSAYTKRSGVYTNSRKNEYGNTRRPRESWLSGYVKRQETKLKCKYDDSKNKIKYMIENRKEGGQLFEEK